MIERISYSLSGEFFLKHHPNGGGVVLARTVYVTFWFYLVALVMKSSTDSDATLSFSLSELARDVNSTIPWVGAIFAGVYAAFYTRYSNQWSYLASTYNQLMAVKSSNNHDQSHSNESLIRWQAGFVSDAYTLHLDRKPIFNGVIDYLLSNEKVKTAILNNFSGKERDELIRRHCPSKPPYSEANDAGAG